MKGSIMTRIFAILGIMIAIAVTAPMAQAHDTKTYKEITGKQLVNLRKQIRTWQVEKYGQLTNGSGPLGTCVDDSECGDGWICVGLGICVPPAEGAKLTDEFPQYTGPDGL
ncbi:hypothetical protein PGB28_07240 [Primorskyibacter aestuariivivens]|uniref:hypothetical protein n=1 Tax=Primorskyibacter aestuariivivens TaxID=1888912 RepID=UPI0023002FD5|nr:hypothetical protein [Primorskyibacter aestuariivivens]MDA7428248.1 hypothetical protein [Primorskyibacter aestuariivivens]